MKIILTGMAGFIGFHCARELSRLGHEVMGIDNLNSYYNPDLKKARLEKLRNLPTPPEFKQLDLVDARQLNEVFKVFEPEAVLHLAAQAGVRYSITHPQTYIDSNIQGTQNILEACRKHNKPRLVFASSSSVYGLNTKIPFSETDTTDTPIALYGATKKANELMAHSYSHLYGMQAIGLRFFTVYGPWGRPDMAIWLFTEAMEKEEPINVFNFGDMYRDFTYIDDIVQGTLACLWTEGLAPFEIFNLGNHKCEQLGSLIELIEAEVGKKAQRNLMPMQAGDVQRTFADISKAQKLLNYHPHIEISSGVPKFVKWFKEHTQFHS